MIYDLSPTCVKCDRPIEGKSITLSEQHYHPGCFQLYELEYRTLAQIGSVTGIADNAKLRTRIAQLLPQPRSSVRSSVYDVNGEMALSFAVYCYRSFLQRLQPGELSVVLDVPWQWWAPALEGIHTVLLLKFVEYPEAFENDAFVGRLMDALARTTGVLALHVRSPELTRFIWWDDDRYIWVNQMQTTEGHYGQQG